MPLTNKHNLPAPLVRAIERHEHKSGDYSASMLSNSARQVWLKRRHDAEIVEDASDRIWALFGTALHSVLAGHEGQHDLVEQYLIEKVLGVTVSGTSDLYEQEDVRGPGINDYKTTSAWSVVYGSRIKEWTEQLNTYAWLYRKAGFPVNWLRIVALLRDWSKKFVKPDGSYPPVQVVTIDIELWDEARQLAHIEERVRMFESHRETKDDDLPLCTDEERWDRGKGPARCDDYCVAVQFCSQRQAELALKAIETGEATAPRARKKAVAVS